MVSPEQLPNIMNRIMSRSRLQPQSVRSLLSALAPCSFPKRYCLVKEGEMNGKAYFIEKGITRSYWIVNGEEITTSFSIEGSVVFSMDEVYYDRLSEEYVETVEAVEAYSIAVPVLKHLVSTDIGLAVWWSKIHQDEYRRLHRSHRERLTLSAADRYREFALQQPQACRRARLTDIASYLGVTLSTLSRIRTLR